MGERATRRPVFTEVGGGGGGGERWRPEDFNGGPAESRAARHNAAGAASSRLLGESNKKLRSFAAFHGVFFLGHTASDKFIIFHHVEAAMSLCSQLLRVTELQIKSINQKEKRKEGQWGRKTPKNRRTFKKNVLSEFQTLRRGK